MRIRHSRRSERSHRGKAADRGLACREALTQGHALPKGIVTVERGANQVLDRLGCVGEQIAMRVEPGIGPERLGDLEYGPDAAFERDCVDGGVRQETG